MIESDDELRRKALDKAYKQFGQGTSIGRNYQNTENDFYVKKREHGELVLIGEGNSWDEAIANARKPTKKDR